MINYVSLKSFCRSPESLSRCLEVISRCTLRTNCSHVLLRINRPLPVISQLWIIFIIVKHSKFPTCWQQVSRRVIQHARLKFQPRTYRISAAPVAKHFEFASEQYFPRGDTTRFGLISGIIISLVYACARRGASRSFVVSIFK